MNCFQSAICKSYSTHFMRYISHSLFHNQLLFFFVTEIRIDKQTAKKKNANQEKKEQSRKVMVQRLRNCLKHKTFRFDTISLQIIYGVRFYNSLTVPISNGLLFNFESLTNRLCTVNFFFNLFKFKFITL